MMPRWWARPLLTLWFLAAPALYGCNSWFKPPVAKPEPVSPDRIVISRWVNGGAWICAEDEMGLRGPDCMTVQMFRRLAGGVRFAE